MQEYAASGDKEEVRRILRDLAVPFFHHEFVKQVRCGSGARVAGSFELAKVGKPGAALVPPGVGEAGVWATA